MTKKPKPMSRQTLAKGVQDLAKRLEDHAIVADEILEAERPRGNHTVLEHNVRTVFAVLMESQLKRLREIKGFARILTEGS